MDKSWISMPRNTSQYVAGLEGFLDFAFTNSSINGRIKCPCNRCGFRNLETREVVHEHLLRRQFPLGYTSWIFHGETTMVYEEPDRSQNDDCNSQDDMVIDDLMHHMVCDAFGMGRPPTSEAPIVFPELERVVHEGSQHQSQQQRDFDDLVHDCNEELYEGCSKYSKLSFLVKLYHIKCLSGMTDKAMTLILELLQDAFEHAKLPKSFYEAKKTINKLGLNLN